MTESVIESIIWLSATALVFGAGLPLAYGLVIVFSVLYEQITGRPLDLSDPPEWDEDWEDEK